MLKVLLPTTLPTAMSRSPLMAAAMLVATSGMGRLYPEGIAIGRVREMSAKGYEASLELEVEPIVDLSRLEHVFVLRTEAQ